MGLSHRKVLSKQFKLTNTLTCLTPHPRENKDTLLHQLTSADADDILDDETTSSAKMQKTTR